MKTSNSFWKSLKELIGNSIEVTGEDGDAFLIRPSFVACWSQILWSLTTISVSILMINPLTELTDSFNLSEYVKNVSGMMYFFSLFIGWGLCARLWYIRNDEELQINQKGIEFKKGVFSRKSTKILYEHICVIDAEQTFIDMIIKTGTINIGSAGTSTVEVVMNKVKDPIGIRDKIREMAGSDF